MKEEYLDIVSDDDKVIDSDLRSKCHGNPHLIHRAVHVLLFDSKGRLLLQKRSMNKDIQPGKWDTSVGGHVESGEEYEIAVYRELAEELGIKEAKLDYLYSYKMRNEIESENIKSFCCIYDGSIYHNREEIDEIRFWNIDEIKSRIGTGIFTPNFEQEFALYLKRGNS